ncbi:MAG: DUF4384 domain-containing protein [Phycisphaerae bacterium]
MQAGHGKPIIQSVRYETGKRIFARHRQVILPMPPPGTECYRLRLDTGSVIAVSGPLDRLKYPESEIQPTDRFLHLNAREIHVELNFTAMLTDANGHTWDLAISGCWRITNPADFLPHAAAAIPEEDSLDAARLGAMLARELLPGISTELATVDRDPEKLKNNETLPPTWWDENLHRWLGPMGGSLAKPSVRWQSASAEKAEKSRLETQEMERLARRAKKEAAARLKVERAEQAYRQDLADIQNDANISAQRRLQKLQALDKQHQLQIQKLDEQAELFKAKHALEIARINQDRIAAEAAARAIQQAQSAPALQRTQPPTGHPPAEKSVGPPSDVPAEILDELRSNDAALAHVAAERLVSPEFGIAPETLYQLGYPAEPQSFVQGLSNKATADGNPIAIEKSRLGTRDIGTARVNTLQIGESLRFQFRSRRPGFVTILNFGTSGNIWLHVPSPLCAANDARAEADKLYNIPGKPLFDFQADYSEGGPTGWEHIAVIISERPLFSGTAPGVSRANPLRKLCDQDIKNLMEALSASEQWTAAVLTFLVEQ